MENQASTEQIGPLNQDVQQLIGQLRQQQQWSGQLEAFTQDIHRSLDPAEVAYTIASDGRLLVDCDRLSVILRQGRRYRVVAISGQETINRRANAVRLLEGLSNAVLVTGESLRYPNSAIQPAPQLDAPLNAYIDHVHPKSILVIPLPKLTPSGSVERESSPSEVPSGALVVEQFSDVTIDDDQCRRLEIIGRHAATALDNSLSHHRIFLRPVWSALGTFIQATLRRSLPRGFVIFIGLSLLGCLLYFLPADFTLTANGTLQPELRRNVFARIDGTVRELAVEEGSSVKPGQMLARLQDMELDVKLEEVVGQLRTTSKKLAGLKATRLSQNARPNRDHELAAEEEELRQWLTSLQKQQALLSEQKADLTMSSPIRGEVITWSVRERLASRPVSRGQLLFTVADLEGPWVLELLLPDHRAGHLFSARQDLHADLDVTFILATDPNTELRGRIKHVAKSTQVDQDQGQTVLVTVAIDKEEIGLRRSGAGVTAKIHCGRRRLGYVWLHDLFEFVQARILFYF